MKKSNVDMLNGRLFPSIIAYTVPIILTSFLQLLFNAADLVVVGNFCGSIAVAAVGATGAIITLIVNLFAGLSVGAGVAVANSIGSGNDRTVSRVVHTALATAIASGAILTVIGIFLSETLLTLMATPPDVLPLSTLYMQIYFAGIIFNMIYNFCASILRAAGDTKSPLVFLSIAGVVNVVLNIIFVTVFNMSVDGVAWATTISQGVSATLVVIALVRRDDACRLDLRKICFYGAELWKMVRIGVPAGVQGALFSIANVIIQSSYNSFGEIALSGIGAANNILGFVYVVLAGYHHTAVNFIGQNYGAGKYERIKKIFGATMICSFVTVLLVGVLAYVFGYQLLSIYIPGAEEAISYGMTQLKWFALLYFLCGLMEVTTGALRGLGASLVPMLISVLGVCGIRVAWVYTAFQLESFHTLDGLLLGYPISWIVTFSAQLIAFVIVYKGKVKKTKDLCLSKK